MNTKKQVSEFKSKFQLKEINSTALCTVLEKQGYTVIEFNHVENDPDVATLIGALGLREQVACSKCFTYQSENYRLVFIHEDLNEDERTIVLAHEEGHIWNGHLSRDNVLGDDVIQEHEANEFAHQLLKDKTGRKKSNRSLIIFLLLMGLMTAGSGILAKQTHDKAVYTDHFYRTESGEKYHLRDCMYIKDKKHVYRLTKKEFESGEYEPCEACIPDEH